MNDTNENVKCHLGFIQGIKKGCGDIFTFCRPYIPGKFLNDLEMNQSRSKKLYGSVNVKSVFQLILGNLIFPLGQTNIQRVPKLKKFFRVLKYSKR